MSHDIAKLRGRMMAKHRPAKRLLAAIDYDKMAGHVAKTCKPNLKRDCKCCQRCPFAGLVKAYMEEADNA